jgi:hypothetical protein
MAAWFYASTASVENSLSLSVMAVLLTVWYQKDRRRVARWHP